MIVVFAFLFSVAVITPASTNAQGDNYVTSIIDGNCTTTPDQDILFNDHVHKVGIPLFTRSATSTYYGDGIIYCVKAINQQSEEVGGHVNITKGGVGHTFVNIEMKSFVSHGIDFRISIYGK
ncbi:uncharacterized protein LOC143196591 [Rhynchophorus ferrugineus]|uniref:uncharacterized protein LOC143196591 n=1 Tax=Rhynchophorus ferrugineus TaxID=354439 RepID=UPI003FCE68DF